MQRNSSTLVRVVFWTVLLVLVAGVFSASLFAQTSGTAALTGTVTDQTGAAIASATVTATNTDNGQVRTTMTGPTGSYTITLLPPGTYNVKFEASGFQTAAVSAVTLNVTETPVLNQSLTVGSQTALVTVESNAEEVQTESSTLGTVVSPKIVVELPLSTRNYLNLLGLSAGANMAVTNADSPGKGSVNLYVNGQNNGQNNFQMDGSIVDNYFSTGDGYDQNFYASIPIPNPDAIQEFKIQTSTYDAGYGRNPGANLDVVLKSGTNTWHGSGFEFFRNTALNANDFFYQKSEYAQGLPSTNGVLDQNQYGGTIGGPIKKDKLFAFFSYQETGQKNGLSNLQTAALPPIPAGNRGTCTTPNWTTLSQCDAATANFVTALAAAISPNPGCANASPKNDTTNGTVGGIQVACPTPPAGSSSLQYGAAGLYNINPVAINMLQLKLPNGSYYIPGSTTTAFGSNVFSDPISYAEHQGMLKLDYTLNSKNTISDSFVYSTNPTTSPFGTNGTTGANLPGAPIVYTYWQRANTLKMTTIATNNLVNEARWGIQRFDSHTTNDVPFTGPQVGMTPLSSTWPQLPQIAVTDGSGSFQIGGAVLYGLRLAVIQNEFADQVSWTHGKHTFRFGGEFENDYTSITFGGLHIGTETYPSFPDFLIGRAGCQAFTGVGTCNATNPGNTNGSTANANQTGEGTNTTLSAGNSTLTSELPADTLGLFVQDDYKLTSRLTVNLGLRWEWYGYASTVGGQWSNTWQGLLATKPIPGTGCSSNGVTFGLGAAGTGCSLAGFVAPSNMPGPYPAGVFVNNNSSVVQTQPKLDNFAPRLGFAWQPLAHNSRWVIRGGGGFFYDRPNGLTTEEVGHSDPPYAIILGPSQLNNESNPFVVPPTVPGPAGTPGWTPRWAYLNGQGAAVTSNLSGADTIAQDFTNGVVYEWNLGTQYEFAPTWIVELGYVGSRGVHLPWAGNSFATGTGNVNFNMAQLASPTNPVNCGYDGNPSDCITTTTTGNRELRVPYLGMSSGDNAQSNVDTTTFGSAQVTVRKQFSRGLTLQAAYTWSRAVQNYFIGNPFATSPGVSPILDVNGLNTNYRPQRLALNYSWNIPTFGEHHGWMGQLVNGWNWSGVTTIQDGTPLLIMDTREGSAYVVTGFGPNPLPTLCPGVTDATIQGSGPVTSRLNNFFNNGVATASQPCGTAGVVFASPQNIPINGATGTAGTGYGNFGIGHISGPGQYNFDMTVQKTFQIRESQSLQLRAEFFNAFNTPQFNNPGVNVASSSSLGVITSDSVNPRLIQFAVKYLF